MPESIKVPNFFYDLIVFISPSLTLTIGIVIGLGDHGTRSIAATLEAIKFESLDFLLLFILFGVTLFFFAYEYGRLAEALSDWIGDLVKFLRKKGILFTKQKDYRIDFKREIEQLGLDIELTDDRMDKWTIYFYAMRFQPEIGSDILKRYAWEKLSRSSSFTFAVLFAVSALIALINLAGIENIFDYHIEETGIFGFGSLAYTLSTFLLFALTCYEYYRRRSWNNDLIIKILPIISLPDNFVSHRPLSAQNNTNDVDPT